MYHISDLIMMKLPCKSIATLGTRPGSQVQIFFRPIRSANILESTEGDRQGWDHVIT